MKYLACWLGERSPLTLWVCGILPPNQLTRYFIQISALTCSWLNIHISIVLLADKKILFNCRSIGCPFYPSPISSKLCYGYRQPRGEYDIIACAAKRWGIISNINKMKTCSTFATVNGYSFCKHWYDHLFELRTFLLSLWRKCGLPWLHSQIWRWAFMAYAIIIIIILNSIRWNLLWKTTPHDQ